MPKLIIQEQKKNGIIDLAETSCRDIYVAYICGMHAYVHYLTYFAFSIRIYALLEIIEFSVFY